MLYDLLMNCQPLREDAAKEAIGFGINHEMRDFRQNKKKKLDLVLCEPAAGGATGKRSFKGMVEEYGFSLPDDVRAAMESLPDIQEVPVGNVLIAFEVKAAMTAHQKACPRLFDELNSSHGIVHGHNGISIAAGLAVVNIATRFISPTRDGKENKHRQPRDARLVVDTVKSLPRRADTSAVGFDALGIVVVDCENNGSNVTTWTDPPAPANGDIFHYGQCLQRVCGLYRSRFPLL